MKVIRRMQRQQGLSLIELMVALLIGLVLTAAIIQMFVGSSVTYSMQSELAKLQENARFAMGYITKDLRSAGYFGCKQFDPADDNVENLLNTHDESPYSGDEWMEVLVFTDGGDAVDGDTPPPSDRINIKYLDSAAVCNVNTANTTAAQLECREEHTFVQGEVLAASDCRYMAIFQMTGEEDSQNVLHAADAAAFVPGNASSSRDYNNWKSNTVIQRFLSHSYFIQDNNFEPAQPALYRSTLGLAAVQIGMMDQELVEGVENMQILLGFDTDGDNNANCYSTSPTACGAGVTVDNIVSARVSLLMRSIEDNITPANQTYVFNGVTYTAADRRLRKVFTATVTLRNLVI